MHRKSGFNPHQGIKYQTYNSIREELESENANLMRERQSLQRRGNSQAIQSQYTIIEQSGLSSEPDSSEKIILPNSPSPKSNKKIDLISNKIIEVIDLCTDGPKNSQTFKEIIEAEKQILGFLNESSMGPSFSNSNEKPRTLTKVGSQSKLHIENIKEESQWNKVGEGISENLMEIIESIERKTLAEIESLRADKISLMKKLNEEIRAHNIEKKKNAESEVKQQELRKVNQRLTSGRRPSTIEEEDEENFENPESLKQSEYIQERKVSNQKGFVKLRPSHVQQKNPAYSHQQVTPEPFFNQNVQHVQSYNYEQVRPSQKNINNYEEEMSTEIQRLRNENNQMKSTLLKHSFSPYKQQLKNELKFLEQKVQSYEQIFANSRKLSGNSHKNSTADVESLFMQGVGLAEEGQRLMRVRSKPEFKSYENFNEHENLGRSIRKTVREQREHQPAPFQLRPYQDKGRNFASGPPGEYERLIEEMKRATSD